MSPILVLSVIVLYFCFLMIISHLTSKGATSATFFTGNKQSPWYLVAFGMIGASLSGVTFISVPGYVGATQFSYFQVVLGYLLGYYVIATVLMPLYYRMNLVSIYGYLKDRFGLYSYKTGSFFFLLSQTIGAAFRLFLVAGVLQLAFFDAYEIPFAVTVAITILLIWLYTFKGGIKTIVWTDTLQTFFMLSAVCISIYIIAQDLDLSFGGIVQAIEEHNYSKMFFWDWKEGSFFIKQFFSGAFIAIVMTGLDQNMMQKNLTCKTLGDAQKNMFWFSTSLIFVNLLFLGLGALLFIYAGENGISIPTRTDDLYPLLALNHFRLFAGVVFLLGITSAAYSSADSSLTALTTAFCIDFLDHDNKSEQQRKSQRKIVHITFSVVLFLVIVIFRAINDESVISSVFKAAGYTYGPLLGLFAFGLFTKLQLREKWVPLVCLVSPIISYALNYYSEELFNGYKFGFEILMVNGAITFFGLLMLTKSGKAE
ncbi:sodium:solute symporter [Flammeovirgaceae bacterium SG7u.111]|nr:sodium:solute symporter [Flammeovirgaceae bacterium SG7u.132]WPO38455.1 sodium:solute symporter [Flammeovirgaceae bacterium SG7u.111]